MKSPSHTFLVFVIILLAIATAFAQEAQSSPAPVTQQSEASAQSRPASLTNKDVIDMVKAGLSPEIVIAKINSSGSKFGTSLVELQELKAAGATDAVIVAMVSAPAVRTGAQPEPKIGRLTDELTNSFKRLQSCVVTVWSETGSGTGFIIDPEGLVMTNYHVIGPSEINAVQFDSKRKVRATLLAADREKDVAVLWINLAAFPDATIAPLAQPTSDEPAVVEGERVFTIGSPLSQRKIMTSGIASKVEQRAIISDININHGNSGGPLFNSLGQVVGITTFGAADRQGGPGLSGIVRIEETQAVLNQARSELVKKVKPEARLLLVEPTDPFPLDAIKAVVQAEKFDYKPYVFEMGDYTVELLTPLVTYRLGFEGQLQAAKAKEKRNKKKDAVQDTYRPLDEFANWAEYVGEYRAVLTIRASPHYGESFWGAVGRGVAANYGIHKAAKLHFKTDFYRMKLKCDEREIEPIQPGKAVVGYNIDDYFIDFTDVSYKGLYTYAADAISPTCGQVKLELFSEKKPNSPTVKVLNPKSVLRVSADFEPYRQMRPTP